MKKKILKIFMLLFLSIVFFACGNDSEKVRSKIEKHLYEKYGEKFVVDRIGTRSADGQKFYQARIYPKSIIGTNREGDSYYYAKSNIDIKPFGRLGKVGDSYDIVQFNEGIEKYVEAKAKELFGNRIRIKSDSKYKKNVNGRFYWAFQHDFLRAKEIVKNDDNYRIEMSLYIYIFDRIETEKDKEQRREEIFEFIQYLKNEGENAKGHIKIKGTLLGENISIIEKESESRWRIVEELYSYLEGEREKKKKEVLKEHEDVEQYKEVINVQFENEDGVEDIITILDYANNVIALISSSYHHYNLELKSIKDDLIQECHLYLIEKGIKSYTPRADRDFALHLKYYLSSFLQQKFHSNYRFVAFPYSFIKQINKIKAKMNVQVKLTPDEEEKYLIFSSLSKKSNQTRINIRLTDFSMNLDNQIALNEAINSSLTKIEGDIIRLRYWNNWTQEKIS